MMVARRGGSACHIIVDGVEVDKVQTAKYMGAMFNKEGSWDDEIENTIGATTRMVEVLSRDVIASKELHELLTHWLCQLYCT